MTKTGRRDRRPDRAPVRIEPLDRHHDRVAFSCGVEVLDNYLRRQAAQDQLRKFSACHVAVDAAAPAGTPPGTPIAVLGYYTLSTYGIRPGELPANTTRRLPRYPVVPAALLGRLAVASSHRGIGLGEHLLIDALQRVLWLSEDIAIHAIVVDALDATAAAFYASYNFERFAGEPLRLFRPLASVARAFSGED